MTSSIKYVRKILLKTNFFERLPTRIYLCVSGVKMLVFWIILRKD